MKLFWGLLVLGCLPFGIVLAKTPSVDIPAQNVSLSYTTWTNIPAQIVSNDQEIKWTKPKNFSGSFDMMLNIFTSNPVQEGEVCLSIGKSDTFNAYNIPFKNDGFPAFSMHQEIVIHPGDEVNLSFSSKDGKLEIKESPKSYFHLTKISPSIAQTEIPEISPSIAQTEIPEISPSIAQTEIPDTTVRQSSEDVSGAEDNGSSMKKNTMHILIFVICVMLCMLFV
ncbi:unnamed protein product [Acanthosepion pharaonis]|uniref:Uncharacterized protein n=1 Tax=Acanthosepion pharaonis TaxID=158019 RepID=A0A812DZ54_ACAPH|nr:unnamed protein product [Sepia pharaonis]